MKIRNIEKIWEQERVIAYARHAVRMANEGHGPPSPIERDFVEKMDEAETQDDRTILLARYVVDISEDNEKTMERVLLERMDAMEFERDEAVAARDHMLKKAEELIARYEMGVIPEEEQK